MNIKQILLILTAGAPADAAVEAADHLARTHGAMVEGICLFHEPEPYLADDYAIGPEAVGEVLQHQESRSRALAAPAEAAFRRLVADRGLSDGWSAGDIETWSDAVLHRARLSDLLVLSAPGDDQEARRFAETLALRSGTPCLFVPPQAGASPQFARVVLAWNGTRESKRALDDGLEFLQRAAAVAVVIVTEEATRWIGRLEAAALARHLARHGVRFDLVRTEKHGRPIGDVLIEQCEAFGADLLVMGAFGHSRAAELILGGATRTALTRTGIPTLLSH